MNCEKTPTGKPSEDRRWMQYYPEMMLKMINIRRCFKIIEEIMQSVYRTKEVDGEEVAEILHYISVQKNQMKKPDTREKFGKFYKKYEDYKSVHNQLDFDDMLTKCYEILVSNEKGLAYCQDKYQFIQKIRTILSHFPQKILLFGSDTI